MNGYVGALQGSSRHVYGRLQHGQAGALPGGRDDWPCRHLACERQPWCRDPEARLRAALKRAEQAEQRVGQLEAFVIQMEHPSSAQQRLKSARSIPVRASHSIMQEF